jgi:uncharacterized RDD family membrane protein YckC
LIIIGVVYPEFLNTGEIILAIVFYSVSFLYYFLFELLTNKTLGKMLSKTIVVNKNGGKPSPYSLFIRNFIRVFLPWYDFSTFLFGTGIHDSISRTIVIELNKEKQTAH